ncbi:MAG TPA: electron transport complex subunit RsxC [Lachnospiraceae bacterium]|jgi:electron transport complex protein RnfC|nr:electron transport complex subunit RsxC [Lachnospiraceae bacterium]MDD7665465.1 electron transport complex subunit RsxC [Lachnospiraceae bacterium]MDY4164777.1 electron transport complex subunit RsxC [Lachnospiraceae bacterium]HAP03520.1 electron transport complex subunit RsxC [Lachnospiraceae bacterium]
MSLRTFKGGVHPFEGKELSKSKPIKELLPQGELVFPVSQHIGAPAKPLVAKGDTVLRGQKIAEAGGFVSSPIYSSVSGTVKAIEKRRTATGDMVDAIVIESDGNFMEAGFEETEDVTKLSNQEIIKKIQDAGVVGMGGAGFPTHVKLSPKNPDQIDYIIANCAECEPYLTSDYREMVEEPEKLIGGLKIVLQLFPNAKGVFAIENNKPDCIEKISEMIKDDDRLSVQPLLTKYPQGGERQLIHAVTGRDINSKMLPADAGCIVDNVATLMAIYDAVKLGIPVMNRVFTVTGDAVCEPRNFRICIGTSFQELLDAAGGLIHDAKKMISGGPMMGFAMYGLDVPTTKTTSALLCLTQDAASEFETTACINCGRCVEACPEGLVPSRLADFAEHGEKEEFEKWYGLECVECGSCSYGCPARRPLAQYIKTMKKQVLADKKKAAAAAKDKK